MAISPISQRYMSDQKIGDLGSPIELSPPVGSEEEAPVVVSPDQQSDYKDNGVAIPVLLNPIQNVSHHPPILKMTREQWKFYIRAMGFHGIRSTLEFLRSMTKTAASTLVGVELSGVLQTQDIISVQPSFTASGDCGRIFSFSVPLDVLNATQTLGDTLNQILLVPVVDMTYFFCGLWVIMRLVSPSLERCLLTREDAWLKRIILRDRVVSREVAVAKRSTMAATISMILDLTMPFFFGAYTALGIRTIQRIGSSFTLPGSVPDQWSWSQPGCSLTLIARINQVVMNTLAGGSSAFSTNLLIGLCVLGGGVYALQAWCDFHDRFQSKSL